MKLQNTWNPPTHFQGPLCQACAQKYLTLFYITVTAVLLLVKLSGHLEERSYFNLDLPRLCLRIKICINPLKCCATRYCYFIYCCRLCL